MGSGSSTRRRAVNKRTSSARTETLLGQRSAPIREPGRVKLIKTCPGLNWQRTADASARDLPAPPSVGGLPHIRPAEPPLPRPRGAREPRAISSRPRMGRPGLPLFRPSIRPAFVSRFQTMRCAWVTRPCSRNRSFHPCAASRISTPRRLFRASTTAWCISFTSLSVSVRLEER